MESDHERIRLGNLNILYIIYVRHSHVHNENVS